MSAPPSVPRTMPKRGWIDADAGLAPRARPPLPTPRTWWRARRCRDLAFLVEGGVVDAHAVHADGRGADERSPPPRRRQRARASRWAATRLCRSSLQARRSSSGRPSRRRRRDCKWRRSVAHEAACTVASRIGVRRPAHEVHVGAVTAASEALFSPRVRTTTSSPRAASSRTRRRPMNPVPPATTIFMCKPGLPRRASVSLAFLASGGLNFAPIRCQMVRRRACIPRVRGVVFGPPKDVHDAHTFHSISLVAMLAWVGLGADGLSSSAYGPAEAFKPAPEERDDHTSLAVGLALGHGADRLSSSPTATRASSSSSPPAAAGTSSPPSSSAASWGVVSGSALLVDYVLTITTSVAARAATPSSIRMKREWFGQRAHPRRGREHRLTSFALPDGGDAPGSMDVGTWLDPTQRTQGEHRDHHDRAS